MPQEAPQHSECIEIKGVCKLEIREEQAKIQKPEKKPGVSCETRWASGACACRQRAEITERKANGGYARRGRLGQGQRSWWLGSSVRAWRGLLHGRPKDTQLLPHLEKIIHLFLMPDHRWLLGQVHTDSLSSDAKPDAGSLQLCSSWAGSASPSSGIFTLTLLSSAETHCISCFERFI